MLTRAIAISIGLLVLAASPVVACPIHHPATAPTLIVAPEHDEGYDRGLFKHWVDADGDGCNTRREVLIAESLESVSVGRRCSMSGGRWVSPYDGVETTKPRTFDIDHLVPLKEAWESGAHAWDAEGRRAFANDLDDPRSLVAVSAASNRSKSDRDPADWLPPEVAYHCAYVADWVAVKATWGLSADEREWQAIEDVLAEC